MNKRKLHHLWTRLRWIKPWHFLLLTLISLMICVLALRANNQNMLKLRDAVFTADQNGGDVRKPLQELQAYVTTHMNTDLSSGKTPVYPPIQLEHTYKRLKQAQDEQYAKANQTLYNDAQSYCEQQNPSGVSGSNRIPCITQYVESRGAQKAPAISQDLYKFSFASPKWSPDLAGWSLVLTILSGLLFIVTLIGRRLLRQASK